MKGHQLLMAGAALSAWFVLQNAQAASRTEAHDCTLRYSGNVTAVPSKALDDCLASFINRKDDIEYFQILASTQAAGKLNANIKRADTRIENLRRKLSADFPAARIDTLNAGPSRQLGNSVRLTFVAITPATKAAMAEGDNPVTSEDRRLHSTAGASSETGEPQIEPVKEPAELPRVSVEPVVKTELSRENFGRIAARMGQDADRDSDESFPIIGLEVAYVRPNTGMPNLRTEMGGTAASMSKGDNLMKRASAHALLGAGFNLNGIILGARALGGGVWDEENKWRDDFGGEGRLGFENRTVSIFAGVGRTQKTARFGLDVGLML
ncbi:MAG: hypothetical protein RLZZ488_2752 [Pseudomonadota bacterium]|jgi:hypothetical protein